MANGTAGIRRRMRARGAALAVLVLVSGVAASAVLMANLRAQERERADRLLDRRAQVAKLEVEAEVRRYQDTMSNLATAVGAQSGLTAADYAVTESLSGQRLSGTTSVALVVPA